MSQKALPGQYVGRIVEHGTDTNKNGLPLIAIQVALVARMDGDKREAFDGETIYCNIYLAGKTEEKTETAVRMARQTLRLCGFDPDARGIEDLDDAPTLLAGNEIPVRVSENEWNGKFFTNYDIALPRGIAKSEAKSLTESLRAAKGKDESPVVVRKSPAPAAPAAPDDIPF